MVDKKNSSKNFVEKTPLRSTPVQVSSTPVAPIVPTIKQSNAILDSNKTAFSSVYQSKGITYRSNDPAVIQRDDAGNIILKEEEQNQLLRIEPISTNITTNSMLKVLDTQFTYYKFPTSFPIETTLDLDLDTDIELDVATTDNVFARYRPNESIRIPIGAYQGDIPGVGFNFVEEGAPQKIAGHYFITPEIKDSGIDLRFRIKIEHRLDGWNNEGYGTAYFSVIKNSPITGLNREFKGVFANVSVRFPNDWGSIHLYEVQTLNLNLVIRNEEFLAGDYFTLGAVAGQNTDQKYHTINQIQSYWVISDASKNVDTWNQEI